MHTKCNNFVKNLLLSPLSPFIEEHRSEKINVASGVNILHLDVRLRQIMRYSFQELKN